MSLSFKYIFPSIKGKQAGRDYYVAMCPLLLIPKIFLFNEEELPPELRSQRVINKSRVPDITNYIISNPDDYVFSALTASVDGEIKFLPIDSNGESTDIGYLEISMNAKFLINDGQHRRAAIEVALLERPEIGEETIAVVFFYDENLERSQQLFADLNKHAVKPSKSLNILYDYRDPLACLCRDLMGKNPLFAGRTEKEKSTISNRSLKIFTLSGIYYATSALLSKPSNVSISIKEKDIAFKYWQCLGEVIPEWRIINKQVFSPKELREEYVHSHSVVLHALGYLGNVLISENPETWEKQLQILADIDWTRNNPEWEGRAMIAGRMSKATKSVKLTTNYLKQFLCLELSPAEKEIEEKFRMRDENNGRN